MNKTILIGRLTRDPDIRYSQGENAQCVARYTIAVDRKFKRDGEQTADFISCVAFGRQGEFAEKYLHKGIKIAVEGRIQTGSYTKQDGTKAYTTEVIAENQEFVESKAASEQYQQSGGGQPEAQSQQPQTNRGPQTDDDGFMNIEDGLDEELPFK
jgi:single-strand DNA-binding protein